MKPFRPLGDAAPDGPLEPQRMSLFRRIVHRGHTRVGPEEVHTVHAEVTDYWYRFESKRYDSPVGHFRTAPRYERVAEHLKFAFVSCQNYTYGYYSAFKDLASSSRRTRS